MVLLSHSDNGHISINGCRYVVEKEIAPQSLQCRHPKCFFLNTTTFGAGHPLTTAISDIFLDIGSARHKYEYDYDDTIRGCERDGVLVDTVKSPYNYKLETKDYFAEAEIMSFGLSDHYKQIVPRRPARAYILVQHIWAVSVHVGQSCPTFVTRVRHNWPNVLIVAAVEAYTSMDTSQFGRRTDMSVSQDRDGLPSWLIEKEDRTCVTVDVIARALPRTFRGLG